MERLKIDLPIIVEGKYDKITLDSVVSARIFTTDGFGLFRQSEKTALFRRLALEKGVIVLLDSDGGGRQIRSYLSGVLPKTRVYHLYIPQIEGKERRKRVGGKAGTLGVEGMEASLLHQLLLPFSQGTVMGNDMGSGVTKADLYRDGLSGRDGSEERRRVLSLKMGLPPDMTANALLAAINLLYTREEYDRLIRDAFVSESDEKQEEPRDGEEDPLHGDQDREEVRHPL